MDEKEKLRRERVKKKIAKRWNLRTVYVFGTALAVMFVIGLILPLRPESSETEKRSLAEFPEVTASGIMDGSFFTGVSDWYADSYPLREGLISLNSAVERLYGTHEAELYGSAAETADEIPEVASSPDSTSNDSSVDVSSEATEVSSGSAEGTESSENSVSTEPGAAEAEETPTPAPTEEELQDGTIHEQGEVAGTVYITNNRAFEIYYFYRPGAEAYASMLNSVSAKLGEGVTVYDMMVPINFSVCLDENIQNSLGGSSARDALDYTNSLIDSSVVKVEVMDTLVKHNAEYIYFNTDHHWTALGAYYAYRQFCEAKGIEPHELSYYTEAVYDNFLGTYYSYSNQSPALAANPDTVYAYIPAGTNDETVTSADGSQYAMDIINDMSAASAGDKYLAFLGGDSALIEIHNPAVTDGSSVLLIKESFGNAFAPFLVDHYENTYVVDFRYYTGNLTEFVRTHNISDVVFMNNTGSIGEVNSETIEGLFLNE